ncbi:radical SAM protein (TIGR01212 family) [Aequitasia blattaphilus]
MLIMNNARIFYPYSEYLKEKYLEKVYKLPVNLPVSCPNKENGNGGCIFCSDLGTGFEAMEANISIQEQLERTKAHIHKKYKANKYIAYFQNYTNTYMPLMDFQKSVDEALQVSDIVEISISTRPDCISLEYLDILAELSEKYSKNVTIELGLQTVNYHTLDKINRGHSLAEFIDAVLQIKKYSFAICTHIILNLPWDNIRDSVETAKILSALGVDIVKVHSLYLARETKLAAMFEAKEFTLCSKEDYFKGLEVFLNHLNPNIAIERLFSRIPKEESCFSNWGTSWWKLKDEFLLYMTNQGSFQGKDFNYLGGDKVRNL